jgi:transcriptional regulator with XRE-family HTH domain
MQKERKIAFKMCELRRLRGETQEELGVQLLVDQSFVSRLESGEAAFPISILLKLANLSNKYSRELALFFLDAAGVPRPEAVEKKTTGPATALGIPDDADLVKAVRGKVSVAHFAETIEVNKGTVLAFEGGIKKPPVEIWIKMGNLSGYPFNVYCWQRAGLPSHAIGALLAGLRNMNEADNTTIPNPERLKAREVLSRELPPPEPVDDPEEK